MACDTNLKTRDGALRFIVIYNNWYYLIKTARLHQNAHVYYRLQMQYSAAAAPNLTKAGSTTYLNKTW